METEETQRDCGGLRVDLWVDPRMAKVDPSALWSIGFKPRTTSPRTPRANPNVDGLGQEPDLATGVGAQE